MEPDSVRVPRTTWNDKQLEVYEMLIYGLVSLILLGL